MMTKEYGIPEWACYVIFAIATILLGLILGLVSIYVGYLVLPTKKVQNFIKVFLSPPKTKDLGLIVML